MTDLNAYLQKRGITEEEMAVARRATSDVIEAYSLREARKAKNMTQAEVAERIGVSQNRVSRMESGDISCMSVGTLRRYIEALGLKLDMRIETPNGTISLA